MRQSPEDMAGHVEGGQAILCERRVRGGGPWWGLWVTGATPAQGESFWEIMGTCHSV